MGGIKPVHGYGQRFGAAAQGSRELHIDAAARFAIEDSSLRYGRCQHLLQAQCLRTKLYQVAVGGLALTALVLHGKRLWPELHDVGASNQTQARTVQQQAANGTHGVATRPAGQVRPLMQ